MVEREDDATSKYPQLNLNTGMSVATVVLLLGMVVWSTGIKNDVGYHEQRLVSLEGALKDLRTLVDNSRYAQAQSETKLEGRLVGIEALLRDVINRLERDRRFSPPSPP